MGALERQEAWATRKHIFSLFRACLVIAFFIWQYATNRGVDVMNVSQQSIDESQTAWTKIMQAKSVNELLVYATFGDPDAPLFDARDDLVWHIVKCAGFPMYLVYRATQSMLFIAARNNMIPSVRGMPTDGLFICIVLWIQLILAPVFAFCYFRFFSWFIRPECTPGFHDVDGKETLGFKIGRMFRGGK